MSRSAPLAEPIRTVHVSLCTGLVAKGAFLAAMGLAMLSPNIALAGCPEASPTEITEGACATDEPAKAVIVVVDGCKSDDDCGDQQICVHAADADDDDPGNCVFAPDGSDDFKLPQGPVEQPREAVQCASFNAGGLPSRPASGSFLGLLFLGALGVGVFLRGRRRSSRPA